MNENTMTERNETDRALERFEASVETPLVPGELERWVAAVVQAWENLLPMIVRLTESDHPEVYAEIQREDRGLYHRVAEMRREDEKLRNAAEKLDHRIPRLTAAISEAEPDEARIAPFVDAFVADATAFVIRLRRQRLAVRTWLMEAFSRDRGTVD